jgi:hypothetical protein
VPNLAILGDDIVLEDQTLGLMANLLVTFSPQDQPPPPSRQWKDLDLGHISWLGRIAI